MKYTKSKAVMVHVLQNAPASLLNRDFQGQDKRISFGNVMRTRISSACWKKDLRERFEQGLPLEWGAMRTVYLPKMCVDHIVSCGIPELDARKVVKEFFASSLKTGKDAAPTESSKASEEESSGKKKPKGGAKKEWFEDLEQEVPCIKNVEFYSKFEIEKIKGELLKKAQDPEYKIGKDIFSIVGNGSAGLSVATLGRMFASSDELTVEGASLHNHPFTVGQVRKVMDDLIATDDFGGSSGSAYMDSAPLTSGTYYRYHCLDLNTLASNIRDDKGEFLYGTMDEAALAKLFVQAAYDSYPTAKRNSTGGEVGVTYMMVELLEEGQYLQYCNAFLKPVLDAEAEEALESFVKDTDRMNGTRRKVTRKVVSLKEGCIDDVLSWVAANA